MVRARFLIYTWSSSDGIKNCDGNQLWRLISSLAIQSGATPQRLRNPGLGNPGFLFGGPERGVAIYENLGFPVSKPGVSQSQDTFDIN